jgi:protein-S-isoprenylcysteine O-methyltransferase Ste14
LKTQFTKNNFQDTDMNGYEIISFGILSLPVIILSWRTLFSVKTHGFYRFFSWECIIWIFITNVGYWFINPFSIHQVISWIFLFLSVYLVIAGSILLKKEGKPNKNRNEKGLYQFEKTTVLVDSGVYRYIRHPLYSSLIFLTWGIFMKQTIWITFILSFISSAFLFLAAKAEERECQLFFGDQYSAYMKRTKRFIPLLF